MKRVRSSYLLLFALRIVLLYLLYALCRVVFAIYNWELVSPLPLDEIWSVIKAGFIFDSASIFYINAPFILLSLLPFRLRERAGYQKFLLYLFVITNAIALLINIADIYYFQFKLSRITADDLHFLSGGNFGALILSFIADYWSAIALWTICVAALWFGGRWLSYRPNYRRAKMMPIPFFISQVVLLFVVAIYMIFAIRGFSFSRASYPITMSDVSLYVNPKHASLALSNPFCLIRTAGFKVPYSCYFDEELLDELYPVVQQPLDSVVLSLEGRPNIVLLILESFGSAHLKSFSDQFKSDQPSYTPFLDSLAKQSYIFTNAFQNGLRSIDALPAIWAGIPSFKTQFLSYPTSLSEYRALPTCLKEMGYSTLFMHGALRQSMSFVSFGQMVGVESFYSREEYEREHGRGDYDGKWGVWDHKFMPFAKQKLDQTPEPFCATLFTLSSHHPFALPDGMEGKFADGTLDIHRMISYSDAVLRDFFESASKQPWFKNTLFVITADHGAGADNDKYREMPYAYSVPIMLYYGGEQRFDDERFAQYDGRLVGRDSTTAQHIDIMPTLLRMVKYKEPFFGFGRDLFNDSDADFAINYYGSAFNYMSGSMRYLFNEHQLVGMYNYKSDPLSQYNITAIQPSDSLNIVRMKALIQQYYRHLRDSEFK